MNGLFDEVGLGWEDVAAVPLNVVSTLSFSHQSHFKRAASEVRTPRPLKRKREDSEGRVRSSSKTPRDQSGVRDAKASARS